MKKKQTLAMLLAAAMVLSMPVGAYAEELDEVENSAGLVEPYIVDTEAPKLNGMTLSSDSVKGGEELTITVDATDEISGIRSCQVTFVNKETKRQLTAHPSDFENPTVLTLEVSEHEPSGTYELLDVLLSDNAGNSIWYDKNPSGDFVDDTSWGKLTFTRSFIVTNEGIVDTEAPKLNGMNLSSNSVNAGEELTITVDAADEISGVRACQVTFVNKETKRQLTAHPSDFENPTVLTLEVSEHEPSGTYELLDVLLSDNAGNSIWYDKNPSGDFVDDTSWGKLTFTRSFIVTNEGIVDTEAPKLNGMNLSSNSVNAGEELTITVDAADEISGVRACQVTFVNKETKRQLTAHPSDFENPTVLTLEVSEYEPSGTYELLDVLLSDNAGNSIWYDKNSSGDFVDDTSWGELTFTRSFTVINDDPVTPPPTDPETPSNPSNPTTPSRPNSSTTTAPGTPINYESEKPDPADEQAVEAYNFWQNTKREIRVYERAGSLRVYVPADVTYMPASVMETLRVENVPVVLQWQGHRIEIPAGKAQPKQPLKAYWPMKTLCELYNA